MQPFQHECCKQKDEKGTFFYWDMELQEEGYRILRWWGTMVKIVAATSWSPCKDHKPHTAVWKLLGKRTAKHIIGSKKTTHNAQHRNAAYQPRNMGKWWTWSILVIHLSWIFRTFWSFKWSVLVSHGCLQHLIAKWHEQPPLETTLIWRNN